MATIITASPEQLDAFTAETARLKPGEETGYFIFFSVRPYGETTFDTASVSVKRTPSKHILYIAEDGILERNCDPMLTADNETELRFMLENLVMDAVHFLVKRRETEQNLKLAKPGQKEG